MAYHYEPLDDPDNQIRLAVVQPGNFDDPIRVEFKLSHLHVRQDIASKSWANLSKHDLAYAVLG